jgi:hypothetical protein
VGARLTMRSRILQAAGVLLALVLFAIVLLRGNFDTVL